MRIFILNQAFYPDVVATAQYAFDLALALKARGHEVHAISSKHGYKDSSVVLPAEELVQGIKIHRSWCLPLSSRGRWRRLLIFISFIASAFWRVLRLGRADVVIALTSPPLIASIGAFHARFFNSHLVYWIMDLNPEEAREAGWLRRDGLLDRFSERVSRGIMEQASLLIFLDRFVEERVRKKALRLRRIEIIPPWTQDASLQFTLEGRENFRRLHGFEGSFVVMYSGNMSPIHPLDTLLAAALELKEFPEIVFVFCGGGGELGKVRAFRDRHKLEKIVLLPYQEHSELGNLLSAADLQVVVMGNAFVGVVHPSKVYNILKIGTPMLYIGPSPSPVTELAHQHGDRQAYLTAHTDIPGTVSAIKEAASRGLYTGATAGLSLSEVSQEECLSRFVASIEALVSQSLV